MGLAYKENNLRVQKKSLLAIILIDTLRTRGLHTTSTCSKSILFASFEFRKLPMGTRETHCSDPEVKMQKKNGVKILVCPDNFMFNIGKKGENKTFLHCVNKKDGCRVTTTVDKKTDMLIDIR